MRFNCIGASFQKNLHAEPTFEFRQAFFNNSRLEIEAPASYEGFFVW